MGKPSRQDNLDVSIPDRHDGPRQNDLNGTGHFGAAPKRLLLSSVFGPFGVDDPWGRKENIMELFHNQVTKAQGRASLRVQHRSYGLYFLAENVQSPVQVLDFPSRRGFIRTLKREPFDAIGISFIAPNFVKAREMARLARELQPRAEIILGGHGAAIEGVDQLIPCDHVVRGEGIRWLRAYLGEDPDRPLFHPSIPSSDNKRVFGIPFSGDGGILVPGVGCVNGCRFCATSHFFGKTYTSFFATGAELFRIACRVAEDLGSEDLFIMDENFFKEGQRARELLALMERHQRPFRFGLFSSAEAIEGFGVENMVRLGVDFVWIGAESKRETYAKNAGRDLKELVRRLRDHGILVLVSGILFLEHHTPENIQEDIDFIIDLEADFTQFMMFTAMPVTALYEEYKAKGLLDFDLPYEEWHGQHNLNWRHPRFGSEEARRVLGDAFRQEYDRNSASILRLAQTALRGLDTLEEPARQDPWLAIRRRQIQGYAERFRLLLPTLKFFAHDPLERQRVAQLDQAFRQRFGPLGLSARALSVAALVLAGIQNLRAGLLGDMPQPRTRLTRYRWPEAARMTWPSLQAPGEFRHPLLQSARGWRLM
jgi:radical SAM superfamily enzyme YgiQ (UPF0313 family)